MTAEKTKTYFALESHFVIIMLLEDSQKPLLPSPHVPLMSDLGWIWEIGENLLCFSVFWACAVILSLICICSNVLFLIFLFSKHQLASGTVKLGEILQLTLSWIQLSYYAILYNYLTLNNSKRHQLWVLCLKNPVLVGDLLINRSLRHIWDVFALLSCCA